MFCGMPMPALPNRFDHIKAFVQSKIKRLHRYRSLLYQQELRRVEQQDIIQLESWVEFYKNAFDLDVKDVGAKIPQYKGWFQEICLVPQGLSLDVIFHVLHKKFKVRLDWPWKNFNEFNDSILEHAREPVNTYIIRTGDLAWSYIQREIRKEECLTIIEYFLIFIKYLGMSISLDGGHYLATLGTYLKSGRMLLVNPSTSMNPSPRLSMYEENKGSYYIRRVIAN